MYIVYALKSLHHDYIYVGMTTDIKKRLAEHNHGYTKSTQYYRPFVVLYTELVNDRATARTREKYRKSGIGKEKLKSM